MSARPTPPAGVTATVRVAPLPLTVTPLVAATEALLVAVAATLSSDAGVPVWATVTCTVGLVGSPLVPSRYSSASEIVGTGAPGAVGLTAVDGDEAGPVPLPFIATT